MNKLPKYTLPLPHVNLYVNGDVRTFTCATQSPTSLVRLPNHNDEAPTKLVDDEDDNDTQEPLEFVQKPLNELTLLDNAPHPNVNVDTDPLD